MIREVVMIALAVVGVAASTTGAVGIVRMPDVYTRIQASSKPLTIGALPVLASLVIGEGLVSPYGARALIVAFLLLVMGPAASHALARAAYKVGVPQWPAAVVDEAKEQR